MIKSSYNLNKYYAFAISAVISGMIFNIIPFPSQALYYGSFFMVFTLLAFNHLLKINLYVLFFVISIVISIIFSESSYIFQQEFRFLAFLIILLLVSPLVANSNLVLFRGMLLNNILFMMQVVTIVSFVGFVVGFYSVNANDVVGLIGISRHSMSLGCFAGFSTIYGIHNFFSCKNRKTKTLLFYMVLIVISILTVALAGSRTALLATVLASVFYIRKVFQNNTLNFSKILVYIIIVLYATSFFWIPYTGVIQNKIDASNNMESQTSSRDLLWQDRINEFEAHPFFGSGFASVDLKIVKNSLYDSINGSMEPGSSWLFLLSSLGLFGFVSFLLLFLHVLLKVYKSKSNKYLDALNFAFLGFYILHLTAEGYVTAGGEFSCVLLWLNFSVSLNQFNN
jgi:O-antigen ligase